MRKGLSQMQLAFIDDRADQVLAAYRYDSKKDTYVDAVRLSRFFGFTVGEQNLPANMDGCVSVSEDSRSKNIEVNINRSLETKRFIITHELSHYLLHYQGGNRFFMHRESRWKNEEEADADYLAACLLMPKLSFRREYERLRRERSYMQTVDGLVRIFCTPRESVEKRIREVCR